MYDFKTLGEKIKALPDTTTKEDYNRLVVTYNRLLKMFVSVDGVVYHDLLSSIHHLEEEIEIVRFNASTGELNINPLELR